MTPDRTPAGRPAPDRRQAAASGRRRFARVTAGSLVAWIGLAVGLGVGLPWLLDAGATATTVVGLLALAVGLTALVATALLVVRSTRGWGRLVLAPWLLAVVAGTYGLSIALAATLVAPSPAPTQAPPALVGAREVTMTTADGVRLSGWYRTGASGAAVVLRHGSGSERSQTLPHAAVLADHGYAVLLTDGRGHGRSQGRAMDLGWNGEADIDAAVGFLAAQPGVDPTRIAVLGLSMGGEEAIGAAGADPRVRAVVAEGATGRTAADKAWLSEEYGLTGSVQEQLDRLTYALVDLLADAPRPAPLAASVAATSAPILLLAAGEVPDEGEVGRRLQEVAPERVSLWRVEGAQHVGALRTDPQQWEQRVVGFLDRALAAPPTEDGLG